MAFESAFWRAVAERSASALARGALQPVSTTSTVIEDGEVARPSWSDIAVNALGFAGALLVRTEEELARLRQIGPMRLLREVAGNV